MAAGINGRAGPDLYERLGLPRGGFVQGDRGGQAALASG